MSKPIRMPQADEQIVLDDLRVEWVKVEELPRFQSLLRGPHYLGAIKPVGERLYDVAAWRGQGLALLVFCAVAKHWRHREQWIGWTEDQRRKRLGLVANNARFLVLPHAHYPNLATRAMGLCLARLPEDWRARSGPPVFLAESFVDTPLFRGTADKAGGWTELGPTQGYGRCGQDYYVKQDRPKALFVKELRPKARRSLCVEHLPAVRGLAVAMLLLGKLMVDTQRWAPSPWRIVIACWAYLLVVGGIWLTVSPWRLRDLVNWANANDGRVRLGSAIRCAWGLFVLVLGVTVFKGS